jgi:hypothetical protein
MSIDNIVVNDRVCGVVNLTTGHAWFDERLGEFDYLCALNALLIVGLRKLGMLMELSFAFAPSHRRLRSHLVKVVAFAAGAPECRGAVFVARIRVWITTPEGIVLIDATSRVLLRPIA